MLRSINIQIDAAHVLGQRACRGRCGCLSGRLRLGRNTWRGRDYCSTGRHLGDRLSCWDCLYTLSSCDRDATRDDCGGGDAESGTGDEIAPGDNRSSMLFSWLGTDRLGRLVACWIVVFRHQTSPFPERLCSSEQADFGRDVGSPNGSVCLAIVPIPPVWLQTVAAVNR